MYFTARHHANQIQVLQMQVAQKSQTESAARKRKSAISMFYVYLVLLVCYLRWSCLVDFSAKYRFDRSVALHTDPSVP